MFFFVKLKCYIALTSEARRDIRLSGLEIGEFSLSSCSFLRNSGGRRMSIGKDMRLLTSCKQTQDVSLSVSAHLRSITFRHHQFELQTYCLFPTVTM